MNVMDGQGKSDDTQRSLNSFSKLMILNMNYALQQQQ